MNMLRRVLPLILLVVASAMANADKMSGFVKGSPSGKTFTLGAKGGPYTVDASKARVTQKGKFYSISSLVGGQQVTVEGTMKGKNIMATMVAAGPSKAAAPVGKTPAVKPGMPAGKPGMKPGMAPPMKGKPGMKPGMPMKGKPTTTPAKGKKPASTAKPKDNSKGKTPVKGKGKGKTDDKSKSKTGN